MGLAGVRQAGSIIPTTAMQKPDISQTYIPEEIEGRWYDFWMREGFFSSSPDPDKPSYSIVMPPPNVTGQLHMGHVLNNTIQDVLIRRAKMLGMEPCWVPGIDHASIATEAKVVAMLREKGIRKVDLTRDEFLKHAWEWKEQYGGTILRQLKKLGSSCDWSRVLFTMDSGYERAVLEVFRDLHQKGHIYRDYRMVNWDVEARTVISNEEVIYREGGETSNLYYVRYKLEGCAEEITVATLRPETIPADTAVAVHPEDSRYQNLIGRQALVPLTRRRVPIIGDGYVKTDFGSGVLKVTPAHDVNDWEIGRRHSLKSLDILCEDGSIHSRCPVKSLVGMDRFEARKEMVVRLKKEGLLERVESITTRIGRSERTGAVIEPRLSLQWFIRMEELSRKAYQVVKSDEIRFYPRKFKSTYFNFMAHIRDWCISRQLWWGQRIPAYHYGPGTDDYVVGVTREEAEAEALKRGVDPGSLRQDEDVLDTWASSWLFPLIAFKAFDSPGYDKGKINVSMNAELRYYYPTKVLVTAPEIIFFWVARMIIAGYEYAREKPFEAVYFTGIVKDHLGKKMSKSLGNSPEPLDLIRNFGADGVRAGMLFCSPAGNDLLYEKKLVQQGRDFANKLWNACRLILQWEPDAKCEPSPGALLAGSWVDALLNKCGHETGEDFENYRLSHVLMNLYRVGWKKFCNGYLEWIKPVGTKRMAGEVRDEAIRHFGILLRMLHPFMPFITEELFHRIHPGKEKHSILQAGWPTPGVYNRQDHYLGEVLFDTVSGILEKRSSNGIPKGEKLTLEADHPVMLSLKDSLERLAGVRVTMGESKDTEGKPGPSVPIFIEPKGFDHESFPPIECRLAIAPRSVTLERESLQRELKYLEGFLSAVDKKLANPHFVRSAPGKVVEVERRKKKDAEAKIDKISQQLSSIS